MLLSSSLAAYWSGYMKRWKNFKGHFLGPFKRGHSKSMVTQNFQLNIKYRCFLHSYIYNNNKNNYKFTKVKWKKNAYAFLIKSTIICWTRLRTAKLLATAIQRIRKNSICWSKNQAIFFTERTYRQAWAPPLPVRFCLLFKNPLPLLHNKRAFWMPPNCVNSTILKRTALIPRMLHKYSNILIRKTANKVTRPAFVQVVRQILPAAQFCMFHWNSSPKVFL